MNQRRSSILIAGVMALFMLVEGCKKPPKPTPPPPPPAAKPVTATLTASPASIVSGQSATLTWTTENADQVTLEGAAVDANGSQTVSPTQATTYHLNATGKGGSQQATAQVNVTAPATPTPTPLPAATPAPETDEQVFAREIQDIFFDYDKADLRPDSQQTLAHTAQVFNQHPNWKVRIEGNSDERGSTEYNLALGERRAKAAKDALAQAGVGADRLNTISYGKEKPACTESTEDCWQKNRRDHFVLAQ